MEDINKVLDFEHQLNVAVYLHKIQPWFDNFKRALFVPNTNISYDNMSYDAKVDSQVMYVPSDEFWRNHVLRSHKPDKDGFFGCNVDEHLLEFTNNKCSSLSLYGVQLTDLSFHVITKYGFEKECFWWKKNYKKFLYDSMQLVD